MTWTRKKGKKSWSEAALRTFVYDFWASRSTKTRSVNFQPRRKRKQKREAKLRLKNGKNIEANLRFALLYSISELPAPTRSKIFGRSEPRRKGKQIQKREAKISVKKREEILKRSCASRFNLRFLSFQLNSDQVCKFSAERLVGPKRPWPGPFYWSAPTGLGVPTHRNTHREAGGPQRSLASRFWILFALKIMSRSEARPKKKRRIKARSKASRQETIFMFILREVSKSSLPSPELSSPRKRNRNRRCIFFASFAREPDLRFDSGAARRQKFCWA